jgi:enediyne biosynthesis protein E4
MLVAADASTGASLQWTGTPQGRSASVIVTGAAQPGFTLLQASDTGIRFTNRLSDAAVTDNQILLIGSGVALGDVDADGLCDIYVCGLESDNALYRNLGGWKFADITAAAGVACPAQYSTGTVLADVDGDGDLDLLVNGLSRGTRLFLNDGKAKFTESTRSGLETRFGPTSMALADVDSDGDLDLYVANYRTNTIRSTGLKVFNVGGRRMVRPEDREQYEFTPQGLLLEHADPDFLYLNDGQGHFTPVSWTAGAFVDENGAAIRAPHKDWGLSVMLRDMNGDGAPDIYVCNDFWSPDRIWMNDGGGHFRALPALAMRNSSTFSMGVDFADINRDGQDDFLVLDMLSRDHGRRMRQRAMTGQNFNKIEKMDDRPQVERNTLYLNRGDGDYTEIAQLAGIHASEWSWGIAFVDVDLDGWEDALITTGHGFDSQDSDTEARVAAMGPKSGEKPGAKILHFPRLDVPNVAFRNRGDLTFEDVSDRWGFNTVGVSHGIALGDLDNDGDQDVVVNNLKGPLGLYRNNSAAPRVAVRAKGRPPNSAGIGARIKVTGGPVPQTQHIISGGRYLSSDDGMRVFAAGAGTNRLGIEVSWRDGTKTVIAQAQANRVYEVDQPAALERAKPEAEKPKPAVPFFSDVSDAVQNTHYEEPFNDFERQPTIPRKLSQLGPGLAWFDFDGDGLEDLAMANGRGAHLTILQQTSSGRFSRLSLASVFGKSAGDQLAVVGWNAGSAGASVMVSQSNYETGDTNLAAVQRFEFWAGGGEVKESLPLPGGSAGPLAVADIDGDGDLDVFVGARAAAGRYPDRVVSRLYRREGKTYQLAAEFREPGLVSGAVFSDLTGDGLPELLLASDWGPVRVWRNDKGRFDDATERFGLLPYKGWWNAVATGDFDGDGQLDIVAANWGRNSPYQEFVPGGLRLYYGALADSGGVEIVEAYIDPARKRQVPLRDLQTVAGIIPSIRERITTAAVYGDADLEQILGATLERASQLTANSLDSMVFLRRGDRFAAAVLPIEAQFAPAFGTCVADFDGDGREDIFLAQNFFGVNDQTSRYDAGRGLWLKGDGRGGFTSVPAEQSGVRVYGEQRGAAVCDYDGDGRVDLAVAQNAAPLKLFHNDQARPGLRVRLKGPPGNPAAFGATLRVITGERRGPVREVQGGSGYLSQNSAIQVLSIPGAEARIWVRWPGGRETTTEVPAGAKEITIDAEGKVEAKPSDRASL